MRFHHFPRITEKGNPELRHFLFPGVVFPGAVLFALSHIYHRSISAIQTLAAGCPVPPPQLAKY